MDEIKLDVNEMYEAIQGMESSYKYFTRYVELLFTNNISQLEKLNSDYIDVLTKMLELFQTRELQEITEAMGEYVNLVREVTDTLCETDQKIALNYDSVE